MMISSSFSIACPSVTVIAPDEDVSIAQSLKFGYPVSAFSAAATIPAPGSMPVMDLPA